MNNLHLCYKIVSKKIVFYYTVQQLIHHYQNGLEGNQPLQEVYTHFINTYMTRHNFPVTVQQKDFGYFERLYKKYLGKSSDLAIYNFSQFYFLEDKDKFTWIGRAWKVVQNNALLAKIDEAINYVERLFVMLARAHARAVEPTPVQR